MITEEHVKRFAMNRFNEDNSDDRIKDIGFAFVVSNESRAYLDWEAAQKQQPDLLENTGQIYGGNAGLVPFPKDRPGKSIGSGPLLVIKKTGEVYQFGSNPSDETSQAAYAAKTQEEFDAALQGRDNLEGQVARIRTVEGMIFVTNFVRESLGNEGEPFVRSARKD